LLIRSDDACYAVWTLAKRPDKFNGDTRQISELIEDDLEGHGKVNLPSDPFDLELLNYIMEEEFTIQAVEAVKQYEPIEWVVEGLLPKGCSILAAGEAKGMKSLLLLHLAYCVANGDPFLGMPTHPGDVLLANFEDGFKRTVRRMNDYGIRPNVGPPQLRMLRQNSNVKNLEVYIRSRKPRLVIIDTIMEFQLLSGVSDENSASQIATLLKKLRDMAQETNTLILSSHHFAKHGGIRGSTAFQGSTDGWWEIYDQGVDVNGAENAKRVQWTSRDAKRGEVDVLIKYENDIIDIKETTPARAGHTTPKGHEKWAGGKKQQDEPSEDVTSENTQQIEDFLKKADKPVSRRSVMKELGLSRRTVDRVIQDLISDDVVEQRKNGCVYKVFDDDDR